jgi:hypothetical protein
VGNFTLLMRRRMGCVGVINGRVGPEGQSKHAKPTQSIGSVNHLNRSILGILPLFNVSSSRALQREPDRDFDERVPLNAFISLRTAGVLLRRWGGYASASSFCFRLCRLPLRKMPT